jgi:uncharacterized damage-inducible protein DinB
MSTLKYFKEMHQASYWAVDKIMSALPEEYLEQPINSSFSNLKAILIHLWNAQNVWYNRIYHKKDMPLPSKNFTGSYSELKTEILKSYEQYNKLLADKTKDYLTAEIEYTNFRGLPFTQPVYQILLQLTHHSAFHRGQIIGFMRQLGFTGTMPQTDLIMWYRENNS